MSIIRKLDELTINRIAAGEVVQRPSAAVKELIENSLDAKSTSISIIVKEGGLELLQIQDNGTGIHKDDMSICCERFTTSKISHFEDLNAISTFGFRGEALASITHVARVSIVSRTNSTACAYKAKYTDGKLIPQKAGEKAAIAPCAGVVGTIITIEDLFYNMPNRKQSFKNANEEYQRICDVVMKYSIHYGDNNIAFSCKKYGSNSAPDVLTTNSTNTINNIKTFFGSALSKELLRIELDVNEVVSNPIRSGGTVIPGDMQDAASLENTLYNTTNTSNNPTNPNPNSTVQDHMKFACHGYITNANYSCKKHTCILFINHRLVESQAIRKVMESIYSPLLPKHTYPFIYLSITIPPACIDVNVHPTKREVTILHEDILLGQLYQAVTAKLRGCNESRVFNTQMLLVPASTHELLDLPPPRPTVAVGGSSSGYIVDSTVEADTAVMDTHASVGSGSLEQGLLSYDLQPHPQPSAPLAPAIRTTVAPPASALLMTSVYKPQPSTTTAATTTAAANTTPAHKYVRTDYKSTSLHQYFQPSTGTGSGTNTAVGGANAAPNPTAAAVTAVPPRPTAGNNSHASEDESGPEGLEVIDGSAAIAAMDTVSTATSNYQGDMYCGECIQLPVMSRKRKLPADRSGDREGRDWDQAVMSSCVCCGSGMQGPSRSTVDRTAAAASAAVTTVPPLPLTSCKYQSIQSLLLQILLPEYRDDRLDTVIKQHVYVGMLQSKYCILQHNTQLLLMNLEYIAVEFFYQLCIKQFHQLAGITLQQPVSVYEYVLLYLQSTDTLPYPSNANPNNPNHNNPSSYEAYAAVLVASIQPYIEMLGEYFHLHMRVEVEAGEVSNTNSTGTSTAPRVWLTHLPNLFPACMGWSYPSHGVYIPELLYHLCMCALHAQYQQETTCFVCVSECLALFYMKTFLYPPVAAGEASVGEEEAVLGSGQELPIPAVAPIPVQVPAEVTRILLPCIRAWYFPSKYTRTRGYIPLPAAVNLLTELTTLPQLYKIFERC